MLFIFISIMPDLIYKPHAIWINDGRRAMLQVSLGCFGSASFCRIRIIGRIRIHNRLGLDTIRDKTPNGVKTYNGTKGLRDQSS